MSERTPPPLSREDEIARLTAMRAVSEQKGQGMKDRIAAIDARLAELADG